jgi:hypothetical protein
VGRERRGESAEDADDRPVSVVDAAIRPDSVFASAAEKRLS